MKKKNDLINSYLFMLEEDNIENYETPNGTVFVLEGNDSWYNLDNPTEVLNTKKLAERCADEELNN